jgi:hypothetical protein
VPSAYVPPAQADHEMVVMALDRKSEGALAPYYTTLNLAPSREPMLALLARIQANMPWVPKDLVNIAKGIFNEGYFPRLRAYAPGSGAIPSWLSDPNNYAMWRKMITTLYKPVDQAFLKSNMALLAAEGDRAANDVAFWNSVYEVTDDLNRLSPIRIVKDITSGDWKKTLLMVGVAVGLGLGLYGGAKFLRKRK